VKFYKNSERNRSEAKKPYVPQYQIMGVEPEDFATPAITDNVKKSTLETRTSPKVVQSYAKMTPSPIGRRRGLVPNVGNNMEHTWSSVDGDIIDDISDNSVVIDSDHSMIDNNDIVTAQALGINDIQEQTANIADKSIFQEGYSLFVQNSFLTSGSLEKIQDQVRLLVFGDHPLFDIPISTDDIFIYKIERMKIKVGVFLE